MQNASRGSVRVIDATLREGCQAPGVAFSPKESAEIAKLLVRIGVDMVECGHPASPKEGPRIEAVREVLGSVPLLCHARATLSDVRAAADAGADWVGVFIGVSPVWLATRTGLSRELTLKRIEDVMREAVRLGLRVRFTVEDTSRTDAEDAAAAFNAALEAGASRICFADTVGVLGPLETYDRLASLKVRFPATEIEVHLHDDRGLALANALAAVEGGSSWVSTSINGLGERCGVVDLASFLANLAFLGQRQITRPELLHAASERVAAHAHAPVDARRPVVGEHAFTHTARLHKLAMARDARAYEWIDPIVVGRTHTLFNGVQEATTGALPKVSAP